MARLNTGNQSALYRSTCRPTPTPQPTHTIWNGICVNCADSDKELENMSVATLRTEDNHILLLVTSDPV